MQARSRPCSPCRRGLGPWRDQAAAAPPSLACWFHCRRNRRWRAPRNNSLMAGPARVQRRHHRLDRSGAHDQRFEILATARLRLIDVISHRLAPTGWHPPAVVPARAGSHPARTLGRTGRGSDPARRFPPSRPTHHLRRKGIPLPPRPPSRRTSLITKSASLHISRTHYPSRPPRTFPARPGR